jgi:hypothetical protein
MDSAASNCKFDRTRCQPQTRTKERVSAELRGAEIRLEFDGQLPTNLQGARPDKASRCQDVTENGPNYNAPVVATGSLNQSARNRDARKGGK